MNNNLQPFDTFGVPCTDVNQSYYPIAADLGNITNPQEPKLYDDCRTGEIDSTFQASDIESTWRDNFLASSGHIYPSSPSIAAHGGGTSQANFTIADYRDPAAFPTAQDHHSHPAGNLGADAQRRGSTVEISTNPSRSKSCTPISTSDRQELLPGKPRVACTKCSKTFSRRTDLSRHFQKHQPGEPSYQCGVDSCGYGGSHRKDKMRSHAKNCHSKGNDSCNIFRIGKYCFPASGDFQFSQDFLKSGASANLGALEYRLKGAHYRDSKPLKNLLTEDGKGIKKMTSPIVYVWRSYRYII